MVGSLAIDVAKYYETYGPLVWRRCRQILKDEDAAYDAMQEVFVRLVKKQDALDERYPSALLYRIATNICLNMIRDGRRLPDAMEDEVLVTIANHSGEEERLLVLDQLERIFGREPPDTRTMAVLHFMDGMTLEETAEAVGMSVSGVRKRLRNLKAKLQQEKLQE